MAAGGRLAAQAHAAEAGPAPAWRGERGASFGSSPKPPPRGRNPPGSRAASPRMEPPVSIGSGMAAALRDELPPRPALLGDAGLHPCPADCWHPYPCPCTHLPAPRTLRCPSLDVRWIAQLMARAGQQPARSDGKAAYSWPDPNYSYPLELCTFLALWLPFSPNLVSCSAAMSNYSFLKKCVAASGTDRPLPPWHLWGWFCTLSCSLLGPAFCLLLPN